MLTRPSLSPLIPSIIFFFFFFNDTPPPEIYPLSLPDALPISSFSPPAAPESGRGGGRIDWAQGRSHPSLSRAAATGMSGASGARSPRREQSAAAAALCSR